MSGPKPPEPFNTSPFDGDTKREFAVKTKEHLEYLQSQLDRLLPNGAIDVTHMGTSSEVLVNLPVRPSGPGLANAHRPLFVPPRRPSQPLDRRWFALEREPREPFDWMAFWGWASWVGLVAAIGGLGLALLAIGGAL